MLTLTVEKGEWVEITATVTDRTTGNPVDLNGATIAASVRAGPLSTDAVVASATGTVLLPTTQGQASVGFRLSTPGRVYAAVTVDKGGASGWPQIERATIQVQDHP
jgi:hypothetical protein